MRTIVVWLGCVSMLTLAAACGGPDPLSPTSVQNVPPGDATGSALSGDYDVHRVTRSCSGICSATISGFPVSVCDVGDTQDGTATVTQTDGRLDFTVGDTPSDYHGGIDGDGSFEVGGYATQDGGNLQITARVSGTITSTAITATASSRTRGTYSGATLNCTGSYDITATAL